ncbi:MAG: 2,3-bisphosphoglycerate-independent phosphoglycerate mutase [Firmicutes bacterium]|jgi:2,3-bisphosphoglycerate-independent phosphoglycerate mutase|nr:2,3-bisphosphoglycerate-independent phosphoglycerate mutase [Bacillota bacterium]MDH7495272.1 2,3-bisphosphoglycerate-independent phosphoglycerate mutase [Bacillota bacterium]
MVQIEVIKALAQKTESKIVMAVVDGLGGLPHPDTGRCALESARTPNLDALAARSSCGLVEPVGIGITPGSGPSHLALFGYDPLKYEIGRGVLEALGVGVELERTDVAARGNFCTVDESGIITDRRAGRIPTEKNRELVEMLRTIQVEGASVILEPGKLHRFVAVFRGDGLSGDIEDTDPQHTGEKPKPAAPRSPEAARTANIINQWLDKARCVLRSEHPANMVLLRGFAKHPDIPTMSEAFKLTPAAIATYPMYRGVARLVGMEVLETGTTIQDEVGTLRENFARFDFFYLHVKETDSSGEDGNFARKVEVLEDFDRNLPAIMDLAPDVLVITGDHSTPATLKAHSWHPVPFLIFSKWVRPDRITEFGETACAAGSLGTFPSLGVLPLSMAHALKLAKFGA